MRIPRSLAITFLAAVPLSLLLANVTGATSPNSAPSTSTASTTSTSTTVPSSSTTSPSSGPSEAYFGHPVGIPNGPVASVSDCPSNPSFSSPLPAGATVAGPTLAPASVGGTVDGKSFSLANTCVYTVSWTGPTGSDPTATDYNAGNFYQAINAADYFTFEVHSIYCEFQMQGGNVFGLAYAKLMNVQYNCNTDNTGLFSHVSVTNGSGGGGAICTTPNFGNWCTPQSQTSQYALYWTWGIWLEDPVGQQNTYDLIYGNAGPYY